MNNLYLGTIVESSDDAIISVDLKGIITSWNKGAERIYGYHETEIIGKPATLIIPVDRRNETRGILERIERGERIEHYETARVTKDGNRIDISLTVSPIRTIEGAIVGASAIGRDITGQKRMVEELKRSETRYRFLFDHMLDGCAHCEMLYDETGHGKDFVYREVNDAFGRLTGLGDVTGKRVSEVVPGILEKHPELIETYARVASTGRPERFEIEIAPLGIWFAISAYSTEKDHFVALFENITPRKQAEEGREKLIAQLTEALSQVKTLSGLLPICSSCKRIRNEKGVWEHVEMYIRDRSEADFTHGICPECAQKLYPDYYKK